MIDPRESIESDFGIRMVLCNEIPDSFLFEDRFQIEFACGGFDVREATFSDHRQQLPVIGLFRQLHFAANILRNLAQTKQAFHARSLPGFSVLPMTVVVVADRNHPEPESGDGVIAQSDVVAGDRTARIAGKNDSLWISAPIARRPIRPLLLRSRRSGLDHPTTNPCPSGHLR